MEGFFVNKTCTCGHYFADHHQIEGTYCVCKQDKCPCTCFTPSDIEFQKIKLQLQIDELKTALTAKTEAVTEWCEIAVQIGKEKKQVERELKDFLMSPSLAVVLKNEIEFSDKAFGKIPFTGPLNHLLREIQEVINEEKSHAPNENNASLLEFADCLLLLLNAFRIRHRDLLAGDLLRACMNKIEMNKKRTWNKPDSDMTFQHKEE